MKSWLEKKAIDMYSTHNERKSLVAEIFIRTLKNKSYKYMNSISKIVYTDKYQNIKIFLQNVTNWFEGVFVIKIVKNTVPWTYVLSDPKGEKIVGTF